MGLFMLALRPECSLKSEDLSECKLFINLEANPGSGTAPSVELRGRDLGDEGGLGKLKWTSLMAAGEGMGEASGVEQTEDSMDFEKLLSLSVVPLRCRNLSLASLGLFCPLSAVPLR